MCIRCEERKAKKEVVLSRANEIAELAILATGEINTIPDALRMAVQLEKLGNDGLLEPAHLFLLIAHFAGQAKALDADNKRLHEALDYMPIKEKAPGADVNKMSQDEALRIIETVVNTFELAQERAMDGANAQIRELKNRFGLNKNESVK